ncbi:MAG: hypothetical protein DRI28_05870 [Caldiserica bacterium]|nr:MAG: hypothetical protein DRI28_05870 [Caldisericota bacterium]
MSTLIFGISFLAFVAFLYFIYLLRDKKKLKRSVNKGIKTLIKNSIRLFSIFLIIGILKEFLSKESVGNFLLNFQGFKGILSGFVGAVMMGPPASGYPIGKYLLENGASYSLVSSFLASWVMLGIIAVSLEFKYLGVKFAVVRNIFTVFSIIVISLIIGVVL